MLNFTATLPLGFQPSLLYTDVRPSGVIFGVKYTTGSLGFSGGLGVVGRDVAEVVVLLDVIELVELLDEFELAALLDEMELAVPLDEAELDVLLDETRLVVLLDELESVELLNELETVLLPDEPEFTMLLGKLELISLLDEFEPTELLEGSEFSELLGKSDESIDSITELCVPVEKEIAGRLTGSLLFEQPVNKINKAADNAIFFKRFFIFPPVLSMHIFAFSDHIACFQVFVSRHFKKHGFQFAVINFSVRR